MITTNVACDMCGDPIYTKSSDGKILEDNMASQSHIKAEITFDNLQKNVYDLCCNDCFCKLFKNSRENLITSKIIFIKIVEIFHKENKEELEND